MWTFASFVLDDSYITFRYSQNVARGDGLVWNRGADPVEGFTSMLWVLINAVSFLVGIDPLLWARVVSLAAVVGTLWVLSSQVRSAHWSAQFLVLSAIALSPAYAMLAAQGWKRC